MAFFQPSTIICLRLEKASENLIATNTYLGSNVVSAGIFWVDGQQPQTAVQLASGSRLKGSGTVGHLTLSGSGINIKPGSSPGILTTSNFNAGAVCSASLQAELNGTTAGSGYDQVTSAVPLTSPASR